MVSGGTHTLTLTNSTLVEAKTHPMKGKPYLMLVKLAKYPELLKFGGEPNHHHFTNLAESLTAF